MTCWMKFLGTVKGYLGQYNINDSEAKQILEDIERDVGHNPNLIKAVVDTEKAGLIKRLKRRSKEKKEEEVAYI